MPIFKRIKGRLVSDVEIDRNPYAFHCDKPHCYHIVCAASLLEAQHIRDTHDCPRTGKTTLGPDIRMKIIESIWKEIDDQFEKFCVASAADHDADTKEERGSMRGLAIALSHLMKPYFSDADEIVRETVRRRNARLAGEPVVTPGEKNVTLFPEEPTEWYKAPDGGYTSNPAMAADIPVGYPADRVAAASAGRMAGTTAAPGSRSSRPAVVTTSTRAKKRTFTADETASIKTAHAAGFDMKMLTTAFACTEADINGVL